MRLRKTVLLPGNRKGFRQDLGELCSLVRNFPLRVPSPFSV